MSQAKPKPEEPNETPMLLRMLHPTSGQQGFNAVATRNPGPLNPPVDPRLAMMLQMQVQQALVAPRQSYLYGYNSQSTAQPSPYMPQPSPYAYQPSPYASRPSPYVPQPSPYLAGSSPYVYGAQLPPAFYYPYRQ